MIVVDTLLVVVNCRDVRLPSNSDTNINAGSMSTGCSTMVISCDAQRLVTMLLVLIETILGRHESEFANHINCPLLKRRI